MKPRKPVLLGAALIASLLVSAAPAASAARPVGHVPLLRPAIAIGSDATQAPEPASPAQPVTTSAADTALGQANAALNGNAPNGDATDALNQLAQVLPALHGSAHRRGEALLARPTEGAADPQGNGYSPGAVVHFAYSAHYCYFWVDSGPDAPPLADTDASGNPDFVEETAAIAEHSYSTEHGPLGFQVPRSDGTKGCIAPDGQPRTDVYLKDLKGGLYGYVAIDPGQRGARLYSYLVLDNDMAEFAPFYGGSSIPPLQVTVAHEYNHVIQNGYDAYEGTWFKESTSTWIEDKVYPDVNDYLQYIPSFARQVALPITRANGGLKIYGSAVWNHWLTYRYGDSILPRAWGDSLKTHPVDLATAAYAKAISQASGGRSSFLSEFTNFAAATAEWRSTSIFPDSTAYPDVTRSSTLRASDRFYRRFVMNHTTYRLANVNVHSGRAVKLQVFSPRGVPSGLALVGRIGIGPGATVLTAAKPLPRGGKGSVRLSNPSRFDRITAVVVNGSGSVKGFSRKAGDWIYRGDHSRYDAGVFRIG